MSEFVLLWLVLAAIYLWDCLVLVPDGCVPLRVIGAKFCPQGKGLQLARRSVHLSPLVPTRGMAICTGDRLWVSRDGMCSEAEGPHLNFAGQIFRADESRVFTGKQVVANTGSPQAAKQLATFFNSLPSDPANREYQIRQRFARLLDARAVRRRLRLYRRFRTYLAWDAVLALLMIVLAPLGFRMLGPLILVGVAAGFLVLLMDMVNIYARLYRSVWPEEPLPWQHIAIMLLAPPAAMRVMDCFVRELFSEFHWIAVMCAAADQKTSRPAMRRYLRELEYPASWEVTECSVANAGRALWKETVWEFVDRQFGSAGDLMSMPERESQIVARYCPRCVAQYVSGHRCSDCGIDLVPFSEKLQPEEVSVR
jgi:hypothetical protein